MSQPSAQHSVDLRKLITDAKRILDLARAHGDPLQIDLAEDGLNDLLQRLSHVTK